MSSYIISNIVSCQLSRSVRVLKINIMGYKFVTKKLLTCENVIVNTICTKVLIIKMFG